MIGVISVYNIQRETSDKICPIMRLTQDSMGDFSCMGDVYCWWDDKHKCCCIVYICRE